MFIVSNSLIWPVAILILISGGILESVFGEDAFARSGAVVVAFGLISHAYALKRNNYVSQNAGKEMAARPLVDAIQTALLAQQEVDTQPTSTSVFVAVFGTIIWGFGDIVASVISCRAISC